MNRKLLFAFVSSILVLAIVALFISTKMGIHEGSYEEIDAHSYTCAGNIDKLATPCSNAADGNWLTKAEWNTTYNGDFNIYIIENFTVLNPANSTKFRFRAYHKQTSSLMPTPMEIYYWNGSLWKQLYLLDDEDHVNEVFVGTLDLPSEAISDDKISIKARISYSSHVIGGIPSGPSQEWHFVEYFEGKVIYPS